MHLTSSLAFRSEVVLAMPVIRFSMSTRQTRLARAAIRNCCQLDSERAGSMQECCCEVHVLCIGCLLTARAHVCTCFAHALAAHDCALETRVDCALGALNATERHSTLHWPLQAMHQQCQAASKTTVMLHLARCHPSVQPRWHRFLLRTGTRACALPSNAPVGSARCNTRPARSHHSA